MFAAALFFDFASCSGTELMGGLCSAATDLSTRWKEDLAPTLSEEKGKVRNAYKQIWFVYKYNLCAEGEKKFGNHP